MSDDVVMSPFRGNLPSSIANAVGSRSCPDLSQGGYARNYIFHASRDRQDGHVGTWIIFKHLKVLRCLLEDLSGMLVAFNFIAALFMFYSYSAAPQATYLIW